MVNIAVGLVMKLVRASVVKIVMELVMNLAGVCGASDEAGGCL